MSYARGYESRGAKAIASKDLDTSRKLEARRERLTKLRVRRTGDALSLSEEFELGRSGTPILEPSEPFKDEFVARGGFALTPAGVISGAPPPVIPVTPVVIPTVTSAVADRNAAKDAAVETDLLETELLVPIGKKDNTKWWILGGVAALWILTRRK